MIEVYGAKNWTRSSGWAVCGPGNLVIVRSEEPIHVAKSVPLNETSNSIGLPGGAQSKNFIRRLCP